MTSDQSLKGKSKPAFDAKKSFRDGHVSVSAILKCRGWHTGDASIKTEGRLEITSADARELARALIEQADAADAKIAKKLKHEENRAKYREREIAAGRLIVMKGLN